MFGKVESVRIKDVVINNHEDFMKWSNVFINNSMRIAILQLTGPNLEPNSKEEGEMAGILLDLLLNNVMIGTQALIYARKLVEVEKRLAVN